VDETVCPLTLFYIMAAVLLLTCYQSYVKCSDIITMDNSNVDV
jgi:hypothetical protein